MVLITSWLVAIDLAPPLEETSNFCLFALLTGQPCPTCGGTRAAISLASLDLDEAFARNLPVTLLILTGLVLAVFQWKRVVAAVRGPEPLARVMRTAGDQIVKRPLVVGAIYLLMWAWNVARW